MQQNNPITGAGHMANAIHDHNSQQITSLSNPVSSVASLLGANNYDQLSRGLPYTPPNCVTHEGEAYGLISQHHPNSTMQIERSLQSMNKFHNNVHPSFTGPVENMNFLHNATPPSVMMLNPNQLAHLPRKVHNDQEFDYFVVVDFEATCDKDKVPYPQEIIEFPSVLVSSATGQVEASFQTYVRPTHHQQLTDFCKELTGIQQIQVDTGVPLSEAISLHDKWLELQGLKKRNFAVVTWSDWDCRVMLESECKFKGIAKPPYFNRWINLRIPFQQRFGGTRCNLKEAVEMAGLTWEGRAHCGLDDARNTARLLLLLMQRGTKFSITASLVNPYQNQRDHKPTEEESSIGHHHHVQFRHPNIEEQRHPYCHCGVKSNKCIIKKPGPDLGRSFFGCGNWNPTTRAACPYFMWASP